MDITFTQREEDFRQEIRDFLQETLPEDWDPLGQVGLSAKERQDFTRQMTQALADKGWLTLAWPEEYGGQARSIMEQVIYNEEMSYKNVPGTELGTGAISWVGPVLMLAGTDEQKAEHLPPIARGERLWCTLYSEPGSGSDLASLQTQATRDGDDYVINGQKIWTSSAHVADWGLVGGAYKSRRAEAPWHQHLHAGYEKPGRQRQAHREHGRGTRLQRGLFRRCESTERQSCGTGRPRLVHAGGGVGLREVGRRIFGGGASDSGSAGGIRQADREKR